MRAAPITVSTTVPASMDLFAGTSSEMPRLQFDGVLIRDAEVRAKPVGADGQVCPVLCLELQHVGPGHHTLHAEQVHTEATRAQAEAAAASLKAGCLVSLITTTQHMRLVLPFVEQIQRQH